MPNSIKAFSDHFAPVSGAYADFRPRYPAALFDWLAQISPARGLAWDCACGSGQASLDLAGHFARVVATDASAAQLAGAQPHAGVEYRQAPAEASGLADASVDLICVAQALHWFDLPRFYAEARRVLKPDGVLAVWTYGVQSLGACRTLESSAANRPRRPLFYRLLAPWNNHAAANPAKNGLGGADFRYRRPMSDRLLEDEAVNACVQRFYRDTVGPYWPPERLLVEQGYRTLDFPFAEFVPPAFAMSERWALPRLLGYFRSWSATGRYIAARGTDPVLALAEELALLWGDADSERRVTWPLAIRAGQRAFRDDDSEVGP